ncbi:MULTISPECIES: hypothetical protein [Novosphingobium]|jgi:hypothetical protein|uniref:hypothetical protein n=1 Tax=Novosphingobium TaxID=165696 RepID=UPI0012ED1FFA|nr:hypothetical protein [Novosphingobium rosa]
MTIGTPRILNYPLIHETSWKANLLARAALVALSDDGARELVEIEAQAMLDYLWDIGFRPTV